MMARVDCDSFPIGPNRTDCYIGLSGINGQKSEIIAGVARQKRNTAAYRKVTAKRHKWNEANSAERGSGF
jgi:hypothetical protein